MKVVSIGTCLSNLPVVQLAGLFDCKRMNNLVLARSDHFLSHFVDKTQALPPIEVMDTLLGLDANCEDIRKHLIENYPRTAGVMEFPPGSTSLLDNLIYEKLDIIVLDNLGDTNTQLVRYKNPDFPASTINFPIGLAPNVVSFWQHCEALPHLAAKESADNWCRIIAFIAALQPQARIFLICAQYCTSLDLPDRYERATSFFSHMVGLSRNLPVDLIAPVDVPARLLKMPDDREHFDMSVYKALAGQIYLATVGNWPRQIHGAPLHDGRSVPDVTSDAPHIESVSKNSDPLPVVSYAAKAIAKEMRRSALSLTAIVADHLNVPHETVTEAAAVSQVDNWDSLGQLNLVHHVEHAFAVSFPFDDLLQATSIVALRTALRRVGVTAADDPNDAPSTAAATLDWGSANLFATFAREAATDPDALYCLFVNKGREERITKGWVLAHALGVASALSSIPKNSIVVIVLGHDKFVYPAFIGCVLTGLIPTILPPLTSKQDPDVFQSAMSGLLDRLDPAAVLSSVAAQIAIPPTNGRHVLLDTIEPVPTARIAAVKQSLPNISGGNVAFLQHSSGTTGRKKGVMLSHDKVKAHIALYRETIAYVPSDTIVSWLPLYHDMGLITSFLLPTISGGAFVSLNALEWVVNPTMLFDHMAREKSSFAWLPNFAFHHIVRADMKTRSWDLTGVKRIINCSEPARRVAFDLFTDRYGPMGLERAKLGVSYAMAENVFAVTQTPGNTDTPAKSEQIYLSSGAPLPNVTLEIRDDAGERLPDGTPGEICISSSSLFDGYYKLEELTAERRRDDWYYTRDIGYMKDGELYVVGRTDDLIIVNGRNIVAHEVEDELNHVLGLAPGRVLLCGIADEKIGSNKLVVLAEPATDQTDKTALASALRELIFSICNVSPSAVAVLPKGFLLKSTSGKLSRAQSLDKWQQTRTAR